MMQWPGVVAPLVWTFALDVLPRAPQNAALEFSIHGLSLCKMPSVSKQQTNINLTLLQTCAFFSGEVGVFH
jgi:hypothetical protein